MRFKLPPDATTQQQTKRLILKDGSYQSVVKYEIQGDRVHYFSAERYEWEDLPASLVDWDATKKIRGRPRPAESSRTHVETPEEREEREKEEANSPEDSARTALARNGWSLSARPVQWQARTGGDPAERQRTEPDCQQEERAAQPRSIRLAVPNIPSRLKEPHAKIQSHVPSPVIYVDIDEGALNDVPLNGRFRIARAEVKKDIRVIGNLKVTFTGKTSQEGNFIPTNVEKIGTGEWVKVTPAQDLPPGEYAVVEMLGPGGNEPLRLGLRSQSAGAGESQYLASPVPASNSTRIAPNDANWLILPSGRRIQANKPQRHKRRYCHDPPV